MLSKVFFYWKRNPDKLDFALSFMGLTIIYRAVVWVMMELAVGSFPGALSIEL
jgi:hypothetical protein